jgi:hypothetical protein
MWKMRLITIGIGGLILAYGVYALYSGKIISTWARFAYRPSPIYWITVAALVLLGGLNVLFGIRSFFR